MTYDLGRKGNAYWRARQKVLASAKHCALCGEPLDFDAPPRSPRSPSVDHIIPLAVLRQYPPAERRRLSISSENLRAAHYGCNSSRGAGRAKKTSPARLTLDETNNRDHPAPWRSPEGRPWSRDWGGGYRHVPAT
jgi:5-methylcytosine-specific restriction endonuclease McrA